jgi:hypothetical protein
MTHTLLLVFAVAGLAWTALWTWIWFMAIRVLRWTYLEKKAVCKTPKVWAAPARTPQAQVKTWAAN